MDALQINASPELLTSGCQGVASEQALDNLNRLDDLAVVLHLVPDAALDSRLYSGGGPTVGLFNKLWEKSVLVTYDNPLLMHKLKDAVPTEIASGFMIPETLLNSNPAMLERLITMVQPTLVGTALSEVHTLRPLAKKLGLGLMATNLLPSRTPRKTPEGLRYLFGNANSETTLTEVVTHMQLSQ